MRLIFSIIAFLTATSCATLSSQDKSRASASTRLFVTIGDMPYTKSNEASFDFAQKVSSSPLFDLVQSKNNLLSVLSENMHTLHIHDAKSHSAYRKIRNRYVGNQKFVDRIHRNGQWFLFYIMEQLHIRNMPLELAIIPIVESDYDPYAFSKAGAVGIWQIMPLTADYLGIKRDWWFDGRRDVVVSTDAALTYLQALYDEFEDWGLAISAYNSGPRAVRKAVARAKRNGRAKDFWSIRPYLPKETQDYLPKVLAITELIQSSKSFGVRWSKSSAKPSFFIMDNDKQVVLDDHHLVKSDTFYTLNAGYNRWVTAPDGGYNTLLVPVREAAKFTKTLKNQIDDPDRSIWFRYIVNDEKYVNEIIDTLDITQVHQFRLMNQFASPNDRIPKNTVVLVPIDSHNQAMVNYVESDYKQKRADQKRYVYHKIKSGDTLWKVASKYKVPLSQIMDENFWSTERLRVGAYIRVPLSEVSYQEPNVPQAYSRNKSMRKRSNYRVRSGDTLHTIAKRFGLAIDEIMQWNRLKTPDKLRVGQNLTIYLDMRL